MTSKIIPRSEITALVESLKAQKKKIVFTNGCFELLHAGHVRYLTEARAQGDCLIVGLNADRSVNQIKDPHRPLIPEDQRAEVLAALTCVSYVVLFEEPDPLTLIEAIKPDVLVKGADWSEDDIIGAGSGPLLRRPGFPGGAGGRHLHHGDHPPHRGTLWAINAPFGFRAFG